MYLIQIFSATVSRLYSTAMTSLEEVKNPTAAAMYLETGIIVLFFFALGSIFRCSLSRSEKSIAHDARTKVAKTQRTGHMTTINHFAANSVNIHNHNEDPETDSDPESLRLRQKLSALLELSNFSQNRTTSVSSTENKVVPTSVVPAAHVKERVPSLPPTASTRPFHSTRLLSAIDPFELSGANHRTNLTFENAVMYEPDRPSLFHDIVRHTFSSNAPVESVFTWLDDSPSPFWGKEGVRFRLSGIVEGMRRDLSEVEMLKMRLGELGSRVLSVEFEDEDEEEEGAVQEEEGVVQEEKEKQENDSVQGQAARNPTDGYF